MLSIATNVLYFISNATASTGLWGFLTKEYIPFVLCINQQTHRPLKVVLVRPDNTQMYVKWYQEHNFLIPDVSVAVSCDPVPTGQLVVELRDIDVFHTPLDTLHNVGRPTSINDFL